MTAEIEAFARRAAEAHRPSSEPYWDAAVKGLFLVKCRACDGNVSHIWKPGDPEVVCETWREALALGLATP